MTSEHVPDGAKVPNQIQGADGRVEARQGESRLYNALSDWSAFFPTLSLMKSGTPPCQPQHW